MKKALLAAAPLAAVAVALALPTAASAAGAAVTVTPSSNLSNGQTVTVTGSGYPANLAQIVVLECSDPKAANGAGCDTGNIKFVNADANGAFTTTFTVKTGTIGTGSCNAGGTCYIAAGDAARTASGATTITFAAASTSSTGSSSTGSSSTGSSSTGSTTPTSVNAGTGGGADRNGVPPAAIVLAVVGGAAIIVGGAKLARR